MNKTKKELFFNSENEKLLNTHIILIVEHIVTSLNMSINYEPLNTYRMAYILPLNLLLMLRIEFLVVIRLILVTLNTIVG